jgi:hypothetical protein
VFGGEKAYSTYVAHLTKRGNGHIRQTNDILGTRDKFHQLHDIHLLSNTLWLLVKAE